MVGVFSVWTLMCGYRRYRPRCWRRAVGLLRGCLVAGTVRMGVTATRWRAKIIVWCPAYVVVAGGLIVIHSIHHPCALYVSPAGHDTSR